MSALPEPDRRRPRLTTAGGIADAAALGARLRAAIESEMRIAESTLVVVLSTLLAGGHLLVEDHPGLGKTRLARTLARVIDGSFARVQATVDLLPGDIVGMNVWRPDSASFEFAPGPVFTNVLLVDELNRATPKTQSGLLEAMQEDQVTVDGRSWPLPTPFTVIATQNPTAGYDGTYPLPPAQLDRFMARISLGYPTADQEVSLLRTGTRSFPGPVSTPERLLEARAAAARVHAGDALLRYVVGLLAATRRHPLAAVGASPRAGLLLVAAARAHAVLAGREFALPDDVQAVAEPVLAHRIQLAAGAPADAQALVVADAIAEVRAR